MDQADRALDPGTVLWGNAHLFQTRQPGSLRRAASHGRDRKALQLQKLRQQRRFPVVIMKQHGDRGPVVATKIDRLRRRPKEGRMVAEFGADLRVG